jgi:hypothetical protein
MNPLQRSRQTVVLLLVGSTHLAVLLALVTLSRLHRDSSATMPETLILLWPPTERAPPPAAATPRSGRRPPRVLHGCDFVPRAAPPAAPGASVGPTDWEAVRAQAAEDAVAANERAAQPHPEASRPAASAAFTNAPRAPAFHWDPVQTQRIEPLEGGGTLIRLNAQCALVIVGLIPLPTCTTEKPSARADLFEHMHDPQPFGAWQAR